MDSNFTNENDPWEYSLDIDDSDLHLTHVLRSSSSAHVEPSPYTPNPVTIISWSCWECFMFSVSDIWYMCRTIFLNPKPKELLRIGEDADFNSGAWVSATNYVNAFGGTVTGCLGDIDNFLKREKLEQVVAIVKSCSRCSWRFNVDSEKIIGYIVPGTIPYKVLMWVVMKMILQ
ncbi:hypothetical protein Tco_1110979 [Tanacetum coccineum]|uniref:Uncharacterized protein n=1 Tax=Tanacetum coccineum TaxID=301880 RepID=A0ABQ5IKB1_9ASTR